MNINAFMSGYKVNTVCLLKCMQPIYRCNKLTPDNGVEHNPVTLLGNEICPLLIQYPDLWVIVFLNEKDGRLRALYQINIIC